MDVQESKTRDGRGDGDALDVSSSNVHPANPEIVLSNGLIAERVASYLAFGDLRVLSMVSTTLQKSFRGTQKFSDNAVLLICGDTIKLDNFLVDSVYNWKCVDIDISVPKEVMEIIQDLLQNVHTMRIKLNNKNTELYNIVDFLSSLFICSPKLTSLRMESAIFEKVLHDVFAIPAVQSQFEKLTSLDIHGDSDEKTSYICGESNEDDEGGPFPRNFIQLPLITNQLSSLKLGKLETVTGSEIAHVKFIPDILEVNAETLEELSLHLGVWKLEQMKTIRCPKLKRVNLSAYATDAVNVVAFLQNHPPLEELTIHMRNYFPKSVLNVIRGKANRLKKLHIKAKRFAEDDANDGPKVDWTFLNSLTELRDFSIYQPFCVLGYNSHYGTGVAFLRNLPPSLRLLHIRGFENFWDDDTELADEIEEEEKENLLTKFKKLRSLRLVRCDRCLNDSLLQKIFSTYGELRELELTNCDAVTDNGLRGVVGAGGDPQREFEKSIENLKELRSLKIRFCPLISKDGILDTVKHVMLRTFHYLPVVAVNMDFLQVFVKQNPSIENVSVFISPSDSNTEIEKKLRLVNPRIRKFSNLSKSTFNAEFGFDEQLEEDNWSDIDTDSEADVGGPDFDLDSDFSGGHYAGHLLLDDDDDIYDDSDDQFNEDYDSDDEPCCG